MRVDCRFSGIPCDKSVNDIRLTLIARDGKVIYDNNDKTPFPTTDHNNRPEVLEARMKGHGHSSGTRIFGGVRDGQMRDTDNPCRQVRLITL